MRLSYSAQGIWGVGLKTPQQVKSEHMIKFEEVVLPHQFTPSVTIEGSVNGKPYCFPRDVESEVTLEQFISIVFSMHKEELWK